MDLPPDKAKLLKQYDNEKKWDIICDQVSISYIIQNLFLFIYIEKIETHSQGIIASNGSFRCQPIEHMRNTRRM